MVLEVGNEDKLVKRVHEELGHFGVTRVISMLQRDYQWENEIVWIRCQWEDGLVDAIVGVDVVVSVMLSMAYS